MVIIEDCTIGLRPIADALDPIYPNDEPVHIGADLARRIAAYLRATDDLRKQSFTPCNPYCDCASFDDAYCLEY